MPAEKVKGLDAVIKFNLLGSLEFYCYAKSFELATSVELIPVSTIGDGFSKRFKPKRYTSTISMDAMYLVTDDSPKGASPDFLEAQLQFVEVPFEITYTGELGGFESISGRAWIQNMTFSATPNGFVSKNVALQVNGGLNRGTTPISMINLTMQCITSPGAISMENVRIVDGIGNETVVFAGTIPNGGTEVVAIPSGTYHIRADLSSNRPYNLFYSDAAPGFSVPIAGSVTGYEYWPYPPSSPIWDFTTDRFLRWQGSDSPHKLRQMKKILIIAVLIGSAIAASGQASPPMYFPTSDSLWKYIDKNIRNSAIQAFTNLSLNTALHGLQQHLAPQDTLYAFRSHDSVYFKVGVNGAKYFQYKDSIGTGGGGSGSPGGTDTQIQFNDASSFGGDAGLLYNKTQNKLTTDSILGKQGRLSGQLIWDPNGAQTYKMQINPISSTAAKVQFQYSETNNADDGTVNPVLWIGHNLDQSKANFGESHLALEGNFQPFPGATDHWTEFHYEIMARDGSWRYRPMSWVGSKTTRSGSWLWHADGYNWFKAGSDTVIVGADASSFNYYHKEGGYFSVEHSGSHNVFRIKIDSVNGITFLNNSSPNGVQTTGGNWTFGGNIRSASPSLGAVLTLEPTSFLATGYGLPPIQTQNTDASFGLQANMFAPNITTGGFSYFYLGKNASTRNQGIIGYSHSADGSSANALFFGTNVLSNNLVYDGTGKLAINGTYNVAVPVSLQVNGTDAIQFPSGNTAARPTGVAGYVRYNTDSSKLEFYNTGWHALSTGGGGGGTYTFSSGLTEVSGTVTANLIIGKAGGQTVIGGTGTTDQLTFKTTTGIGATGADMVFTGGNNGATEFARILNNGNFGIGENNPGNALEVTKDQNAITEVNVNNNFSGTSVQSRFGAYISGSSGFFGCYSATAGAAGALSPASTYIQGTSSAGLVFMATDDAANIKFATGSAITERARFNANGEFQIGSTTDQGAYTLQNTGGFYQSGAVHMDLGSDANYDTYYRGSDGLLHRIANGTTGQFLGANTSAAPTWQSPSGGTTIYSGSGSLASNRTVDGSSSNFTLRFGDFDAAKALGQFRVDANDIYMNGGFRVNVAATSDANYTILGTDYFVELPTATTTRTITLPTASTNIGRILIIRNKNSSGSTWVFGTAVKDGSDASVTTLVNDTVYQLISNGTDWLIIN